MKERDCKVIAVCVVMALFLMMSGCKKSDGQLRATIIHIKEKPLLIPYDKLYKTGNDSLYDKSNVPYRMVVFTDSQSCASCALKHVLDWDPFIESLGEGGRRVTLMFLFDPPSSSRKSFIKEASLNYDDFPIYVDTCHAFITKNPQISNTFGLHVFLVNDRDSVLIVGNPRSNSRIQKLFFDIIDDKEKKI